MIQNTRWLRFHLLTGSAALCLVTLTPMESAAKKPIRDAFFANYPSAVGTVLDTVPSKPGHCGVCHYKFDGGGARNLYGVAVENNGGNSNAVWVIRSLDSDGDGFANMAEVNTNRTIVLQPPTFPG